MNIAVVGTGYVGLVSGACFAEMGVNVTCVDVDKAKIDRLLSGEIPIYEPGLDEIVERNIRDGRLHFTTDLTECLSDVEIVFSAVGTPPDEDGSADLSYVLEVARTVGRNMDRYVLLVTKSTVPVGTSLKVKAVIEEEKARLEAERNPGGAFEDMLNKFKTESNERQRDIKKGFEAKRGSSGKRKK